MEKLSSPVFLRSTMSIIPEFSGGLHETELRAFNKDSINFLDFLTKVFQQ